MDETFQVIHDRLIECNLGASVRVSLSGAPGNYTSVTCFLLLSDRYNNIDELFIVVENCLNAIPANIYTVGTSRIVIIPN